MRPTKLTPLSASSSAWRHAEADAAWPTRPESLEIDIRYCNLVRADIRYIIMAEGALRNISLAV